VLFGWATLLGSLATKVGPTRSCTAARLEVSVDCMTAAFTVVCNSTANIDKDNADNPRAHIAVNIIVRANRAPIRWLLLMSLTILSSKIRPSKMLNMNACDEYCRDTSAAHSNE